MVTIQGYVVLGGISGKWASRTGDSEDRRTERQLIDQK